jgi:RNA polymerase sigma-70 factor, ECF subfamily
VMSAAERQREGVALIRRMAGGDREAFGLLYTRLAPLAFALTRRIVVNEGEAEEVLQEVFWQIWQDARSFDERRGSPEAWVLNRARSRAIDRVRSIRRRSETFVGPLEGAAGEAAADPAGNPASAAADRVSVRTALALLPEAQRQAIELAYFGGFTQAEIARRLGEPLGTVKTRMRTGLDKLRGHFRGANRAVP